MSERTRRPDDGTEPPQERLPEEPTQSLPAPGRVAAEGGGTVGEAADVDDTDVTEGGDANSEENSLAGSDQETGVAAEDEPEPFSAGPPPLPEPMLVLDGDLQPVQPDPAPEVVDHGTCAACSGAFDADGWCTQCGQPKPHPRDHFTDAPAPHVAAVCDRGIRHSENQDSMAVMARQDAPDQAAMVVCDGVSSAPRSGEASLAASAAAIEDLADPAVPAEQRLAQATASAAAAVVAVAGDEGSPSCTFVAAVLDGDVLTVGSVGDSRAYWFPDDGDAVLLTTDDSMAEEQIRAGMGRAEAESGPLGHTITRWLGPDAPDQRPAVSVQDVSAAGWAMLCSDGLWNYASEPVDLAAVLRTEVARVGQDPLQLAQALVEWANRCGGADNVTVALARVRGTRQDGMHV